MMSSESAIGVPFPVFEGGFTPWDGPDPDLSLIFDQSPKILVFDSSPAGSNSGSDPVVDERKRRRMISNRESARRSRMRKQKHLENLRAQVNRLRVENRELKNRLRLASHHCHLVQTENHRLQSEELHLRRKLSDYHGILLLLSQPLQQFSTAWPCNIVTSVNNEQIPPLILWP